MPAVKIAHISDLHVLDLTGTRASEYMNKRLLGYANLRFKRERAHHVPYLRAVLHEIARVSIDHVVITGDLTNLALAPEFRAVRRILDEDLGYPPARVSIVPGNHDVYVASALRTRQFATLFAEYTSSELPQYSVPLAGGNFPFVRVRGPIAIVGLSSAVPRPPLMAAGLLGKPQLRALERILGHETVRGRTIVVLVHHPTHKPPSPIKALLESLHDADELERILGSVERGLVLHGHLHRRLTQKLPTHGRHSMDVVGGTSASLHHRDPHRMAGFNVYDFDEAGLLTSSTARVYAPEAGTFHDAEIPVSRW